MAIIFIRSLLIYVVLLIIMRFMGKRQIGEMQPFEFVVTLLIAELACIPMSDVSIPLLYGVAAIFAVFIIHQIMALLEKTGLVMKFLLGGKPSLVITKNGVDFNELKQNNLDVSDLIESMRGLGYFALDAVDYAIYESNGTLSAIEKSNPPPPSLPLILISEGKEVSKNLTKTQLNLDEILNATKIKNVKSIGIFTLDGNGRFYCQEYNKKYFTGMLKLKENVAW